MSSSRVNLDEYLIPLKEILVATENFNKKNRIGGGEVGDFYKGQLSERWQNRTVAVRRKRRGDYQDEHGFGIEVEMISIFNHKNIIPFIGYCDEDGEMITVSEYVVNDSLEQHLSNPDKRRSLTWVQRLEICLGAATGFEYLHSGLGEGRSVMHRNIKSGKMLLDDNFKVEVCGFDLSLLVDQNKPQVNQNDMVGTTFYMDPLYKEDNNFKTESDVYSFGVVMFEVLSGMFAYERRSIRDNQKEQILISLVRRYYEDGLDNLIDPHIRDQVNMRSFNAFKDVAYQCISWNLDDRPTMNTIIKRIQEALNIQKPGVSSTITTLVHQHQSLESFVIPLKEILLATQNFSHKRCIGGGGSGKIYRGELSQNRIAAFKRLDKDTNRAEDEFYHELRMVSSFNHENIIGFIGYCDEDEEKIIVYNLAINGSMDQHLHEPDPNDGHCLTWAQRLKICIGVARGLEYLHSGLEKDNRVIHRCRFPSQNQ